MSRADPSLAADRGIGETAIAETAPDAVVDLFALVTRLGDPVTLLLVVVGGYLLADQLDVPPARMATALALALGAFALTLALKHAFVLPRPPGAAADGYGFPSGHALGATVVYGGLAALLASRRGRVAAAALIALVACSRVVIGVHYLVDVVAGTGVGIAYLAATLHAGAGWRPDDITAADARRAFAIAVGVSLVALSVAVVRDTVVASAAAVGGLLGWQFAADRIGDGLPSSRRRFAAALVVLPGVALVVGVVLEGGVSLPVAALLAGGIVALLLALPGLSASVSAKNV